MAGPRTLKTASTGVASASRSGSDSGRAGASRLALLALLIAGLQGGASFFVLQDQLPVGGEILLAGTTAAVASVAALFGWLVGARLWRAFARDLREIPAIVRQAQQGSFELRMPTHHGGMLGDTCRSVNRVLDEWELARDRLEEERESVTSATEEMIRALALHHAGDREVRCTAGGRFEGLADAINQAMDEKTRLEGILLDLSDGIGHSAEEIRAAAQEAHGDAQKQREACGETGARTSALCEENEILEDLCGHAATSTQQAEQAGRSGQSALEDLVSGMEGLQRETRAATIKIKRLGERSMQVAAITGTISKMSAQTDMLALNAAIEASRAGEQGHGFTVVAEEVRKLAEKAAQAAKEVERLIQGIQSDIAEAVGGMERQGERIEVHSAAADDAQRALDKVLTATHALGESVAGVVRSANTQRSVAEELGSGLHAIGDAAARLERAGEITRNRTDALLELCHSLQAPATGEARTA